MRLRTLGGLALTGAQLTRHRPLLLLTYLALEGSKGRRFLAELMWPQAERPRHNLEMALYHLRRAAPDVVRSDESRLWTTVDCDASQLRTAAAEHRWHEVIDMYRGPFLEGVDVAFATSELEEWVLETREMLASTTFRGLVEVAERARAAGDVSRATDLAERAASLLPSTMYDDASLLMRLHSLLVALDSPRAIAIRREAAEFGVRLEGNAAGVSAPTDGRRVDHTLPSDATPFVGRVRELSDLEGLIAGDARVVTIHGLSGMGKTRLAIALAHRQVARGAFDEAHFIALEAATDANMLLERISHTLAGDGVAMQAVSAVRTRLGSSRVLLVLDDVAHDRAVSALIAELSATCPQLTLVITSLWPLDLPGELLYAIDGLRVPDTVEQAIDRGAEFGATHLFTRTAQRYDPRFTLGDENAANVLALCRSVAGAPLGIEMAAALTRVVPPVELARDVAASLDAPIATTGTVPPRHASLRAVFGRSWAELDAPARAGLAGASVFEGEFTRSAAAAVLNMHVPLLTTLLDRSLLRREGSRYTLHWLVRQYAAEQLAVSGAEDAARERHAVYFCGLLESKRPFDQRSGQRVAFEELDREFPNIRAAWEWAVGSGRGDLLERMLPMLGRYLLTRRRLTALTGLLDVALAVTDDGTTLYARALRARAEALMADDPLEARTLLERSLTIVRAHGTEDDEGAILHLLATASLFAGDFAGARGLALAAKPFLERRDPEGLLGACFAQLASATTDAREWEELMERAAAYYRTSGRVSELGPLLYGKACHLAMALGNYPTAVECLEEAIRLERDQVDRGYLLGHLHTANGYCLVQKGDLEAAALQLQESERLFSQEQPWEGRQEWEGPEARGAQRDNWALAYLHEATGRLDAARSDAAHATDYPVALVLLIRLDIDAGALNEAEEHLAGLTETVFGPIGLRQALLIRALKHLYHAEIAQARSSAAATTPSNGAALHSGPLVGEVLSALAVIRDAGLIPLVLEAIVVARLVAPSTVPTRLLAVAATHPSAAVHTRRRAAHLLTLDPGAHEPTADDATAPPLGPDEVLGLVDVLEPALRPAAGIAHIAGAGGTARA